MKTAPLFLALTLFPHIATASPLTLTCIADHYATKGPIVVKADLYRTGALKEGAMVVRVGIFGDDMGSQTKYASYSNTDVSGFYNANDMLLINVNKLVDPSRAELDIQYRWSRKTGTLVLRQPSGEMIGSDTITCKLE